MGTRVYTCSVCGGKGHNKRACGKLPPTSPSLPAPARRQPSRRSEPKPIDDVFTKVWEEVQQQTVPQEPPVPAEPEPPVEGFTAEDLETWWELSHTPKRNAAGTETAYPVPPGLEHPPIYDLKEADKKLSADVDLCAGFLSTIPDDVSLATQPGQWRKFLKNFPMEVLTEMVKRPNIPEGVLAACADYTDMSLPMKDSSVYEVPRGSRRLIIGAVAQNPRTPVTVLTRFALSDSASVREAVAQNPNLPSDMCALLAVDPDLQVRTTSLGNRNCPSPTLARAATDPNWEVRWVVAARVDCPETVRTLLENDPHECVRAVAQDATKTPLGKRKKPARTKKGAAVEPAVVEPATGKPSEGAFPTRPRHIGVPKSSIPVIVAGTVSRVRTVQSDYYGSSRLIVVNTRAGEVSIFTTASWAWDGMPAGTDIVLKGTVRTHGDFNDTPTTRIARAKLLARTAVTEDDDGE